MFRLWLFILTSAAITGFAAGPIVADVKPVVGRERSNAPQALDIKLTVQGIGLLEGVLEVYDPKAESFLGYRFRTQELALPAGSRTMRIMLPGFVGWMPEKREVNLRFLAKEQVFELGQFPLGISTRTTHILTICVSKSMIEGGARSDLVQGVRLEQAPKPTSSVPSGWLFATSLAPLPSEELPSDPLAYCAYDMLLLEGAGFSELRLKQLTAIESWVRAGGILCIVPGTGLKAEHAEFLNRIAELFTLEAGGGLAWKGGPRNCLARSGLGRVAILPSVDAASFETPEWKGVLSFLWRKQSVPPEKSHQRTSIDSALLDALMSKSVHLIPRSVLFCLAGGFLLAVGPLDYLVLGKLRRRRLTWVLFPMVAIAFTGATIWLAGRSLGDNSQRAALILTDIAPDGKVVRESRFEMVFAGAVQEVVSEGRNALFSPLPISYRYNSQARSTLEHGPLIEGQFPAHYSFRRTLQQWTPEINRFTSIGPAEDTSGLPWERIASALELPLESRSIALSDLRAQHWQLHVFPGGESSLPDTNDKERTWIFSPEAIKELCIPYSRSVTAEFSQVSPNGLGSFDDCALMDANEPGLKVLTAARREGDNIHLFRRLYRK